MAKTLNQKVAELSTNGYNFNFGSYISEGFNIFGRFAGGYIGYILLIGIILITSISLLLSMAFPLFISEQIAAGVAVVVIGMAIAMLVLVPLSAGFFIVADKIARREEYSFGTFFEGFQTRWGQLVLIGIITLAITFVLRIVPIYYTLSFYIESLTNGTFDPEALQQLSASQPAWMTFVDWVTNIISIYLSVSWSMAQMHVIFNGASAWEAMEASRKIVHRRWWIWFLFTIVIGIISALGLIGLVVGVLITAPAMLCATYAAYADVMTLDDDDKMDETSHFIA